MENKTTKSTLSSYASSEGSFTPDGSNAGYKLVKVIGKGTYSTVYLAEGAPASELNYEY
jgi:serine/threonine protein kinase